MHSWSPVYKTVNVPEQGHWETVVITPAWTEEFPIYQQVHINVCNDCGAELDSSTIDAHSYDHIVNGTGSGSWRSDYRKEIVGYDYEEHPAVTDKKWVVDSPATTRQELSHYKCSCGATK